MSKLGTRTSLSNIPIVDDILFQGKKLFFFFNNNFLLTGDKFMPELHLRQPGFTYTFFKPFTKHREMIQIFKETGD